MLKIEVIKGPLSNQQLMSIANLYGKVDAKYASIDFCRYLFNDNPFGYSYHCFALNQDKAVGHIALIPVSVETPTQKIVSYKAEAFVIEAEYRDEWVKVTGEELPIGLALPKYLYQYADEQQIELIHLLADNEIGKIHLFAGCIQLPIESNEQFLILDSKVFTQRQTELEKKILIRCISIWQQIVIGISLFFIKRAVSKDKYVKVIDGFKSFLPKLPVHNHYQWSISQTEGFLTWFYQSPYIKVYTYKNSLDDYIVVKESEYPGRATEIIDFKFQRQSLKVFCRLIYSIITKAKSVDASSVCFKNFHHKKVPIRFKRALLIMGFLSKRSEKICYLRTKDSYYHFKDNLSYNQLFYIQY